MNDLLSSRYELAYAPIDSPFAIGEKDVNAHNVNSQHKKLD